MKNSIYGIVYIKKEVATEMTKDKWEGIIDFQLGCLKPRLLNRLREVKEYGFENLVKKQKRGK